jgi:hypothetical protein
VSTPATHITELNRKPQDLGDGISKPTAPRRRISLDFERRRRPHRDVYKVTGVTIEGPGDTFSTDLGDRGAVHSATNFVDLVDAGFGYDIRLRFAERRSTSTDGHPARAFELTSPAPAEIR